MSTDPTPYRVVARRFRPRTFDEVVGQQSVLQSLKSALEQDRVPHALLFSGSRGVGKTTLARIVARALNCEEGPTPTPCGKCHACLTTLDGKNPDVVEIDAASHNLVDDIRDLRDRVGFASMGSRYKVYILDEVHMLTRNAFNAFLKTLEEPPKNVVFILATTELHKVPETIRSRCQVHLFRRIGDTDIIERLRAICTHENLEVEDGVLGEIAAASRGGMRDAETALERVLPVALQNGGKLDVEAYRSLVHRVGLDRVTDVVEKLLEGDGAAGLHFAAAVAEGGVDEREALGEVVDVLRAILVLSIDGPESGLVVMSGAVRERLVAIAKDVDGDRIDAMIQAALLGRERIRRLDDRRLVLEITMLRLAEAGRVPSLADVVSQLASGAPVTAAAAPAAAAPVAVPAAGIKGALSALVSQRKPMLQATVDACDFQGPDEQGVVTIKLTSHRKMHADRLASTEVRALLTELLTEIAGRPVQLQQAAGAGGAASIRKPSSQKPPGKAVDRIAKKFDGKFLEDS